VATTTIPELNSVCSRSARQPIDALRDQRQLRRLPISDDLDSVACFAAVDMLNRGAWQPSFVLDPQLCPGRTPAYAVGDTLEQVVDIAWVANVLAGPSTLPVGVATSTIQDSRGGLRSLVVVVLCR
jgi:hypothetical protein